MVVPMGVLMYALGYAEIELMRYIYDVFVPPTKGIQYNPHS